MRQENTRNTDNPTVYNRLRRYDLSCSICPPNRNENAMKKKPKKLFCYTCGHELILTERIYAYDEKTGNPLITLDRNCPNGFFTLWHHPATESEAVANYLSGLF